MYCKCVICLKYGKLMFKFYFVWINVIIGFFVDNNEMIKFYNIFFCIVFRIYRLKNVLYNWKFKKE